MNHQQISAKGSGLRGTAPGVTTTNPGGPPACLEGMNMSNHTPGPWSEYQGRYRECPHYKTVRHYGDVVVGADGVAVCYMTGMGGQVRDGQEMAADRALIAAAPELLAACREIVAEHDAEEQRIVDRTQGVYELPESQAVSMARAAIAKAEGGAS